jgi:SRSO17 transposase
LRDYCLGLLMPIARKSVEPMAAVTAPGQVASKHQSLLHFVGNAPWSDAAMLAKVSDLVLPAVERSGPIEAWIIDDTGFPKKGRHSVGVTRQYCGQLGKQDNCQVAVSLSLANHHGSLPIAYRLYLPEEWARDRERREKARVPDTIGFRTKPEIALEQFKSACAAGLPRGVVLMDAGYGNDTELRTQLTTLDLSYVAGIGANTAVWPPGTAPLPPLPGSGRGRPPKLLRRDGEHHPVSVKTLAHELPAEVWHNIAWREGSADWLASRFARVRVRPAHRDTWRAAPRAAEWLLIEWPQGEPEPTKYWLSTMPQDIPFDRLVDLAKIALADRARLPGTQAGTRLWRLRRARLARLPSPCHALYRCLRLPDRRTRRPPPSGPSGAPLLSGSTLPCDYRPRGAADPARTARAELDCHHAPTSHRRPRPDATEMPLLQRADPQNPQNSRLLTQ